MDYLWLVIFFVGLVGVFWYFYANLRKYVDERFSWVQQRLENISEPLFSVKERMSDLQEIKKDLTKLWIDLFELLVHLGDHVSLLVEDDRPGTRCTLIERKNVLHENPSFCDRFRTTSYKGMRQEFPQ